uniref:hypothetical protein n=1 Tax=Stappia sp. TaxID=1870903 RepID=UPI003BAD0B79
MKPKTPVHQKDPIDAKPGDSKDVEQTALTISSGEIAAAEISEGTREERIERLKRMKADLEARMTGKEGDELAPLRDEIDRALARLNAPEAL